MQPVEAGSGLRIEHWNGGVVVAEEPRQVAPRFATGRQRSCERAAARVGERGDLDRLLVERGVTSGAGGPR